jgi:NADH-quinone oxidoreductase subunit H
MIATMLIPTILASSMSMSTIINSQKTWYVVVAPLAAIIFMVTAIAELGRAPFDMNEAESEIVAGFHIEYTGMKFGLFYAGELMHAFTFGGFWAILFFGGYRLFGLENLGPLLAAFILLAKALFGYWVIMWIRYTVMRIRIDNMLSFSWKFLTPLSFVLLMITAFLNAALRGASSWVYIAVMFITNFIIGWIVIEIIRREGKRGRVRIEKPVNPAVAHL